MSAPITEMAAAIEIENARVTGPEVFDIAASARVTTEPFRAGTTISDDAEHLGGGWHRMADPGERHLKGVERAGADVAIDHAERGKRQKPRAARVMQIFRLIEDCLRKSPTIE